MWWRLRRNDQWHHSQTSTIPRNQRPYMYLFQEKYKFTHFLNSVVCKLQHTSLPTAYSKAKKNKIHKHYNEIQEESNKNISNIKQRYFQCLKYIKYVRWECPENHRKWSQVTGPSESSTKSEPLGTSICPYSLAFVRIWITFFVNKCDPSIFV